MVKNLLANAVPKRLSPIPWQGGFPGGGNGKPLQYSFLENPLDSGAWWATIHRVTQSDMTEVTVQYLTDNYS